MVSHGTLLFDSNLEMLVRALNPRQVQITSNAVQSVRSVVMNLREVLPAEMDMHGLREAILRGVFGGKEIPTYTLTEADWESIHQLVAERYETWEWNIGRSPKFSIEKSGMVGHVRFHANITIDKGCIQTLDITSERPNEPLIAQLKMLLLGVRYDKEILRAALRSFVEREQLVELFF